MYEVAVKSDDVVEIFIFNDYREADSMFYKQMRNVNVNFIDVTDSNTGELLRMFRRKTDNSGMSIYEWASPALIDLLGL